MSTYVSHYLQISFNQAQFLEFLKMILSEGNSKALLLFGDLNFSNEELGWLFAIL